MRVTPGTLGEYSTTTHLKCGLSGACLLSL
jgi:hypothetical protein